MPLEKYFLMSLKDIFIDPFGIEIKSSKSLSSHSPIIYVAFTTKINNENHPNFLGISVDCLNKLHITMKKTKLAYSEDNQFLEKFLKEIVNLLIKQIRIYILKLDKREISISQPTICKGKGQTVYGLTRNFLINNEDMTMSY